MRVIRDTLRGAVRFYTLYSPLHRGKDRLRTTLAPWIRPRTSTIVTSVPYGQRLRVFTDEYVSDQIYYYGCFERELVTLLAEALQPGMVFLDMGAHLGLYTVIASSRVGPEGHVYAFEPSAETFALLQENVALNGHTNVECVRAAVSDRGGAAVLYLFGDIRAASSLGRADYTDRTEEISCVTIDEFLTARGDLWADAMKVDIEGAERLALRGACRLLSSPGAPGLIQIELDEKHAVRFGYTTRDVSAMLVDAGYELFVLDDRRLHRLDWDQPLRAVDGIALRRGTTIAENVMRFAPIA